MYRMTGFGNVLIHMISLHNLVNIAEFHTIEKPTKFGLHTHNREE